jgi:hypothetical protein
MPFLKFHKMSQRELFSLVSLNFTSNSKPTSRFSATKSAAKVATCRGGFSRISRRMFYSSHFEFTVGLNSRPAQ